MTDQLTFGVNLGGSRGEPLTPVQAAVAAEQAGFDVVTVADHVGHVSPLICLAAAAAVTSRVRLRTYVLDIGFWNAGLLARDVATLDVLSGGRVEVGLGAGHMPHEHAAVELPFPPYRERLAQLDAFAADLARRLADPEHRPRPVQDPVPILLAAMSPSGLDVAARHGSTVALSGLCQITGRPPGTFMLASAAQTDERVARLRAARAAAGLAEPTLDALLQQVVIYGPPEDAAAQFIGGLASEMDLASVLDSPFVLYAPSPQAAAQELLRRSQRWGITSWCTHAPSGPALAEVMRVLRGS
jgi:probable F420-dependent oxidoreductase